MTFRISLTPTAHRRVKALRGKAASAYEVALASIAAEGCAAADYRLSGDVVDRICSVHLCGRFRALVSFPDDERVVILLLR